MPRTLYGFSHVLSGQSHGPMLHLSGTPRSPEDDTLARPVPTRSGLLPPEASDPWLERTPPRKGFRSVLSTNDGGQWAYASRRNMSGWASCMRISRSFSQMSGSMPNLSPSRLAPSRIATLATLPVPCRAGALSQNRGLPSARVAPPIGLLPRLPSGPGAGRCGKNAGHLVSGGD
jgi:hypothetical protein